MKVAEILSGPEKWWHGTAHDPRTSDCIWSAVVKSVGQPADDQAANMLSDIIGLPSRTMPAIFRWNEPAIFRWNDAPERTFDEVHAVAAEFDRRWALRSVCAAEGGRP